MGETRTDRCAERVRRPSSLDPRRDGRDLQHRARSSTVSPDGSDSEKRPAFAVIRVYVCTVVDPEFSVDDCTFDLVLHRLNDDTLGESTLTDRLRRAKALSYSEYAPEEEPNKMLDAFPYHTGLPAEGPPVNQLRSVVLENHKPRTGQRRLLMQLLLAVAFGIIIGVALASALT